MRRVATALLAALASAMPLRAAEPAPGAYDWCSDVVVRPDQRRRPETDCEGRWSDAEIAAGAGVVLLGSYDDVSDVRVARPATRCNPAGSHVEIGRTVERLRALRAAQGGPPLRVVHLSRFDLVAEPLAGLPGFQADFLVGTDRPWSEVEAFFARDTSPACAAGGCRLELGALAERIDAAGGPGRHRSAVYYLARVHRGDRRFRLLAALADLGNPIYRAWRVGEARRAIAEGGYDAIELNQKFFQYRTPHWVGGDAAHEPADLRAGAVAPFTAPPRGYGYPAYVAGWAALAAYLREAQVPYAVTLGQLFVENADDSSTEQDEAAAIRAAARGARIVLLDRQGRAPTAFGKRFAAELREAGAEVHWMDSRCGLVDRGARGSDASARSPGGGAAPR